MANQSVRVYRVKGCRESDLKGPQSPAVPVLNPESNIAQPTHGLHAAPPLTHGVSSQGVTQAEQVLSCSLSQGKVKPKADLQRPRAPTVQGRSMTSSPLIGHVHTHWPGSRGGLETKIILNPNTAVAADSCCSRYSNLMSKSAEICSPRGHA